MLNAAHANFILSGRVATLVETTNGDGIKDTGPTGAREVIAEESCGGNFCKNSPGEQKDKYIFTSGIVTLRERIAVLYVYAAAHFQSRR